MSADARLTRAVFLIAVVAFTLFELRAQDTAQSQGKCAISGTVLDAISQQPVWEATVTARALAGFAGSASNATPTITDGNGRFSFDNLPPGRYRILASHKGYLNQGPGTRVLRSAVLDLAAGQHRYDVIVNLMPSGSIAGQISGGGGKPVSGVTVQALRRAHRFGEPAFDLVARVDSDKSGEYLLTGLPQGDYYVRAVPRMQPISDATGTYAYGPVFYPAVTNQSQPTLLVLRAGEQLAGINVALSRVHTAVIKGRVVDAVTKAPISKADLTLMEDGHVTPLRYSATADAGGNFELKNIPRGNYVLEAEKPLQGDNDKAIWGQKQVQVTGAELRNLEVAIGGGVRVSGRILVDSKASVDLTLLTGALQREQQLTMRGIAPEVQPAAVQGDGSFVFNDVPAGNYRLEFSPIPAGFYLKSEQTADVLEFGMTVVPGQPIQALDLVLDSGVARVEGTAMKDQKPSAGAVVVLVPNLERRGQPRYYRHAFSDAQGRFTVQNVIPGDYEIFALQEFEPGSYLDPDFSRQFEDRGKAISLKEGASLNLQLDVIAAE